MDLLVVLVLSATAMLATLLCTTVLSVSPLEGFSRDSSAADLALEPFCLLLVLACVPSGEKDICVASVEELELILGAGDLGDSAAELVITLRGLSMDRSCEALTCCGEGGATGLSLLSAMLCPGGRHCCVIRAWQDGCDRTVKSYRTIMAYKASNSASLCDQIPNVIGVLAVEQRSIK